jgi:hypothetical protein
MKDFYYILSIDVNCTSNEVREAYHKLSKKFHPDANQNDSYFDSRFLEISEAYETLIDPVRRGWYDTAFIKSKSYLTGIKNNPTPYYSKTRRVDIIFSAILAFITLVFGYYVYKSVSGHSKAVTALTTTANVQPAKHHKRKHPLKTNRSSMPATVAKNNDAPVKTVTDTPPAKQLPKPVPVIINKPAVTIPPIVANPVKNIVKPVIVDYKPDDAGFLYTTYIKSNVTGVVYMRQLANYHADVVTAIPANSKVTVLQKGAAFYKVMFSNQTGYVPKWTVQEN